MVELRMSIYSTRLGNGIFVMAAIVFACACVLFIGKVRESRRYEKLQKMQRLAWTRYTEEKWDRLEMKVREHEQEIREKQTYFVFPGDCTGAIRVKRFEVDENGILHYMTFDGAQHSIKGNWRTKITPPKEEDSGAAHESH